MSVLSCTVGMSAFVGSAVTTSSACWQTAMCVPTAIIPRQKYALHSYTMSTVISLHHYVSTNSLVIKPENPAKIKQKLANVHYHELVQSNAYFYNTSFKYKKQNMQKLLLLMVPNTQFSQGPDVTRRCEGCAASTVTGVQAT